MNGFPERKEIERRFMGRNGVIAPEHANTIETIAWRVKMLASSGWKMRDWRPSSPGSPCTDRVDGYPGMKDWDHQLVSGWMDHPYRLIDPDGATVFVSEPYGIAGDALIRLHYLHKNGWRVSLRPEMALHYPGHTLAIWIEKRNTDEPG